MIPLIALLALTPAGAPLVMDRTVKLPKAGGFDAMAFDAENHRLLAAHPGANTLAVLDTESGKVQEIQTGAVSGVAVAKKLNRYFVAGGNKELLALDRQTLKIVGRAPLSAEADLITVDTKRGQVVVCQDDGVQDWVFDGTTLASVGTIAIEEAPEFLEYDKNTDRIYQNIKSTDHLQVIDPESHKVVATWKTAPMKSPHGLVLDKKAGRAYAAGKNGKLVVFDIATGKVIAAVDIAEGTDGIAIDTKMGRVYCPGKGKMTVVSTIDNSVVGQAPVPEGTKNVAVDPSTHTVWINVSDAKGARLVSFKQASQ